MKDCLGESPTLTVESFISALTEDVSSYANEALRQDQPQLTMTSTFYEVFGFNWDDNFKRKKDEGPAQLVGTATFIDYAADTYRSALHYTAIWTLFILTGEYCQVALTFTLCGRCKTRTLTSILLLSIALIYLNFFRVVAGSNLTNAACDEEESQTFGCTVGNNVAGWILNAVFCG
jgi:hypothetical protein